jgi:hypothetical protein
MEAEIDDPEIGQFVDEGLLRILYGNRLVMEDERHDVIARRRVGVAECPRFVHEHAQCLFGLRHCITVVVALDKEMVAGISSRHQREVSVPASR